MSSADKSALLWRRRRLRASCQFIPGAASSTLTSEQNRCRPHLFTGQGRDGLSLNTPPALKLKSILKPYNCSPRRSLDEEDGDGSLTYGTRDCSASTRASDNTLTASRLSSTPLVDTMDPDEHIVLPKRRTSFNASLQDYRDYDYPHSKFVSGNHVRLVVERFALRPSNMSF
eukprot:Blabericola_migrator_1__3735@NODE_211_length_11365_cov_144_425828_g181_i0_p7_GENE_NODE_211_length_11365_cov_144_425828_g181_i0NODE_211_length_11365_cov_144_425828_g181_i0_p7_ORF_typecomplete_len182_score17_60_NODE_211_length_11365_cov_144_425828_g181_i01081811333